MCGLFGILSKRGPMGKESLRQILYPLYGANLKRGNQGFGIMYGNLEKPTVSKKVGGTYASMIEKAIGKAPEIVVGHVWSPTGGPVVSTSQVHPLYSGGLRLFHNGAILNTDSLAETFLKSEAPSSDTLTLVRCIRTLHEPSDGTLVEAIEAVLEEVDGQHACVLFDESDGCFYFWRVMSPLFVLETPEALIFSSIEVNTGSLVDQDWEELAEGQICSFTPETGLVLVSEFDFNTIYDEYDFEEEE